MPILPETADTALAPGIIRPDWPLPAGVEARYTTRHGGSSRPPHDRFNLGDACGDDPAAVVANRARLRREAGLPAEPHWLRQVHGRRVLHLPQAGAGREADGAVTAARHVVCAVLGADCLPLLICRDDGGEVGAIHAGWRGLAAGVIDAAVAAMAAPPSALRVWLGPCIGPRAFIVRADVRDAFISRSEDDAGAFTAIDEQRWQADLAGLAERRLHRLGVTAIQHSGLCSHDDPATFYSHRRDGVTGRMAALIWRG